MALVHSHWIKYVKHSGSTSDPLYLASTDPAVPFSPWLAKRSAWGRQLAFPGLMDQGRSVHVDAQAQSIVALS